jgi:DNA-binding GntR family transcriptional regulator
MTGAGIVGRHQTGAGAVRIVTPMSDPEPDEAASAGERRERRRFAAEVVYTELRGQILGGMVQAGQRLVEERLAEEFNTSRTPVREALRRLEGDGYLVRGLGGSLQPALPDVDSMSDSYDVRMVIEELSVRRATVAGDRAALGAIRDDWVALSASLSRDRFRIPGPDFVYTDERFHQAIATATGNQVLTRMLSELNDRIRTLRIQDFTTPDRVEATIAEHLEIINTVLLGDADAAATFMRAHVQRSALIVRERATAARSRMAGTEG